jgi:hypothetical protein
MDRNIIGCKVRSFLFLLVAVFVGPVLAHESSTHGEVYGNLWPSNVEQALDRVRAEEQHATPNDQQVLAGVRANLAATLALYESPDEPLPPPPMLDRMPTARVYLAADEQDEPRERRRGEERTRRDDARPRERREVESQRDDAGEESINGSAARQREEMIERFQEMRQRMEGNRPSTRDEEPAPHAPPHPRIVNALQTQQEQLEQLANRIERLERRLRELQSERPEASPVDREDSHESIRGQIRVETERRERQMAEARRAAQNARREELNSRRAEIASKQTRLEQAQHTARVELDQARMKVQTAETEAQRKLQELESLEQSMAELRKETLRLFKEQRGIDEIRQRDRGSERSAEGE